jgi:hypothetical protein
MEGVTMANTEAGERTLEIGGERLTLVFTTSAYLELEDVLGVSAGKLEQKFRDADVGFRDLQAMIWAGSRKNHRKDLRTLADVAELMDEIPGSELGFPGVWEIVTEAYAAGQGNNPNGEDGDAPKSRRERRQGRKGAAKDQDKPEGSPGNAS